MFIYIMAIKTMCVCVCVCYGNGTLCSTYVLVYFPLCVPTSLVWQQEGILSVKSWVLV